MRYVLLLVGVLLSACGPAATPVPPSPTPRPTPAVEDIEVWVTEFAVRPSAIEVAPGRAVNMIVHNDGTIGHTWQILGVTSKLSLGPGRLGTVIFTAPTVPASYPFYCDIPGHKEAGEKGALVVKAR
jgi:plastocyanin